MDKFNAITKQEELLLKKKQEIERKRREDNQKKLLSLQNSSSPSIKTEDTSSASTGTTKSRVLFSRHKALLRSGLIGKSKLGPSSSAKRASSSMSDCFEASEVNVKLENSTGSKPNIDSSTSKEEASASAAASAESSAAWFQEALQRAKLKAQEANAAAAAATANSNSLAPPLKKSRWESPPAVVPPAAVVPPPAPSGGVLSMTVPSAVMGMVHDGEHLDAIKGVMLTQLTRQSPAIVAYARQVFGNTEHLSEDQWKQCEDQIKMNVVFQLLQAKQRTADRLAQQGKVKYEYDSDEEVEGGTWEHRRRKAEMDKTAIKATELTEKGAGKHHIGDFLPPEELQKFMEKFSAIREGRDPDFSDYRDNKLTEDNIGYKMLKSMGWTEGQGLGPAGMGIKQPVNQNGRVEKHGLGIAAPDSLSQQDDEYDAYRKRMMLSYRFRPNPLNNPRRPYY